MTDWQISPDAVNAHNKPQGKALAADYAALGEQLARRGVDIDGITKKVAAFHVAVPSWGVGTGGTRFARFPGIGEPRNILEKLDDCCVIHQLSRAASTLSAPDCAKICLAASAPSSSSVVTMSTLRPRRKATS